MPTTLLILAPTGGGGDLGGGAAHNPNHTQLLWRCSSPPSRRADGHCGPSLELGGVGVVDSPRLATVWPGSAAYTPPPRLPPLPHPLAPDFQTSLRKLEFRCRTTEVGARVWVPRFGTPSNSAEDQGSKPHLIMIDVIQVAPLTQGLKSMTGIFLKTGLGNWGGGGTTILKNQFSEKLVSWKISVVKTCFAKNNVKTQNAMILRKPVVLLMPQSQSRKATRWFYHKTQATPPPPKKKHQTKIKRKRFRECRQIWNKNTSKCCWCMLRLNRIDDFVLGKITKKLFACGGKSGLATSLTGSCSCSFLLLLLILLTWSCPSKSLCPSP